MSKFKQKPAIKKNAFGKWIDPKYSKKSPRQKIGVYKPFFRNTQRTNFNINQKLLYLPDINQKLINYTLLAYFFSNKFFLHNNLYIKKKNRN